MSKLEIQPELRTSGGEALSLHRDGEWIGDVFLIYRENDLLTGTVQLDQESVEEEEIDEIIAELRSYLVNLAYALNVTDHNIHVYYGEYSHLEEYDEMGDSEWVEEDEGNGYERWIVGHSEQGIEYQIYDRYKNLIAEAVVDVDGTKIIGEINFTEEPTEELMEDVEAILLKDYDHDLVDQYNFTFLVGGDDYEEVTIEPDDKEDEDLYDIEMDDLELLERIDLADEEIEDEEGRERVEVIFDLVDREDQHLAEAKFLYSEDGVDVTVLLQFKPTEEVAHHIMKTVFKEALTEPMEWINIRMLHKGKVIDGFHFERGEGKSLLEV
ncbi:MAG TPA: hypothetical protein VJ824_04170 [Bacillota bacterium]|nr:hypothetical protein [Bacillota bacterium]